MGKGDYVISEIYQGGYSSLIPSSGNYMAAGSFGATTDPRSANVLQEVSTKLNMGVKQIEIEGVSADIFDSIPQPHMKEVNRLAKLTGVEISLHGPVIDVAGFTQQGFSENERMLAERKVAQTLLRSHELNPDGNIIVNFHSAEGIPGSQLLPPGKRTKEAGEYQKMMAVDRETGQMVALEPEVKHYPGYHPEMENLEKGKRESPEDRLRIANSSKWGNQMDQVFFNQERANELLGKNQVQIQHLFQDIGKLQKEYGENVDLNKVLTPTQKQAYHNFIAAKEYIADVHKQVNNFFSSAYKFGNEEQKHQLNDLNEEFKKMLRDSQEKITDPLTRASANADAMRFLVNKLKEEEFVPQIYIPIEKFAVEKTSQTYGNAAFQAYKKFKDKSPVLVIENPPAGFALSTGKDIKNIVEASRKQFVDNAIKPTDQGGLGMSEKEAGKQAEKFIGATWDVGHINMLRKFGYEEKDIIAEAKEVAPFVKHVHLSDNFGYEHTELPMGMGNVPLKEIMEKLGQKGYDARKIIEAGNWWQHFRTPPFQEVLEASGSPLYSMNMAPYWSQAQGLYQGYHGGLDGQWLPQINYETFGAGFSRLPAELGGNAQGAKGGRMSGRPME